MDIDVVLFYRCVTRFYLEVYRTINALRVKVNNGLKVLDGFLYLKRFLKDDANCVSKFYFLSC